MKKLREIAGIGLASILAVSLAACGSSASAPEPAAAPAETETVAEAPSEDAQAQDAVYRTLDQIKESGTVNIGVFSDKNPFGYVDENGEYQGYDVYFGNRIGEDLRKRRTAWNIWRQERWTLSLRTSRSLQNALRRSTSLCLT